MITRFKIKKLFGLYSYDIDWNTEDKASIDIITGPNGFGKTTILSLVNSFFRSDLAAVADVVFDELDIFFDGKVFHAKQERIYDILKGSDVQQLKDIKLTCKFYADEIKKDEFETFEFYKNGNGRFEAMGSLALILQSQSCCYLTDNRLFFVKDDRDATSEWLGVETVERVRKSLLALFKRYGGCDRLPASEKAKLDLLSGIIDRCRFANKELVLDNYFGIRFRMDDDECSFIMPSQLSSGEKHILVQAYTLLFEAKEGAVALVDEPELSFHPAWLNQYVDNLQQIQKIKKDDGKPLQIIIATHSPMLIGQRWDMCVDLFENNKQ